MKEANEEMKGYIKVSVGSVLIFLLSLNCCSKYMRTAGASLAHSPDCQYGQCKNSWFVV